MRSSALQKNYYQYEKPLEHRTESEVFNCPIKPIKVRGSYFLRVLGLLVAKRNIGRAGFKLAVCHIGSFMTHCILSVSLASYRANPTTLLVVVVRSPICVFISYCVQLHITINSVTLHNLHL